ncbi:hypothetical protein [Pseudophaeobacter sp.]|uniref:hypothetical protein n=1 Tax=Pseudophaeobacter sp. TaxID=1971739 RepID=UPI00329792A4
MIHHRSLSALRRLAAVAAFGFSTVLPAQALEQASEPADAQALVNELILVEQAGCEWCLRWSEEIGPIYPKTREGAFAPLRRVDLRALPDDLQITRRVNFTPTFLIVQNGEELARLEGYPGEDFFWPLLAQLMQQHLGFTPDSSGQPES